MTSTGIVLCELISIFTKDISADIRKQQTAQSYHSPTSCSFPFLVDFQISTQGKALYTEVHFFTISDSLPGLGFPRFEIYITVHFRNVYCFLWNLLANHYFRHIFCDYFKMLGISCLQFHFRDLAYLPLSLFPFEFIL